VNFKDGDRILDVLVEAGGPTLKAAPERVRVLRGGAPVTTDLEAFLREGTLELNPAIQPGDIVVLPETDRRVIVLGQVVKPGPIDLGETFPRTVMDAIAAAGGPANLSKLTTVYVIRQAGTATPTGIQLDLWKYLHEGGLNQNIPLKAGDVVFVPQSPLMTLQTVIGILSGVDLIRFIFGIR
jgi:protein involved in polysaccharide export with SLBB domain